MKINGWEIEYWEETFQLLWRNRDVVANSYKESRRTQTLKKKNTGDHLWNLKQLGLGITGSVIPVVITESSEKERGKQAYCSAYRRKRGDMKENIFKGVKVKHE